MKTTALVCLISIIMIMSAVAQNEPPAFREVVVANSFGNPEAVAAGDINGDGMVDVAAVGEAGIRWWKDMGNDVFEVREFAPNFTFGNSVYILDMNADGDNDIIASGDGDRVLYWENIGGGQWDYFTASDNYAGVSYCAPGDFNNDGTIDIMAGGDIGLRWFSNLGGGTFNQRPMNSTFTNPTCIWAGDLDGDWDDDIVATRGDQVHWFRNEGFNTWTELIISNTYTGAQHCDVGDVDGDGNLDIVTTGDFGINWWQNDGAENFTLVLFAPQFSNGTCVTTADIDADGTTDLVGTGNDTKIRWWQNQGGFNSWLDFTIDNQYPSPTFCYVYDFGSDGDMDVLTCGTVNDDVTLWISQPPDVQVTVNQIIADGFPLIISFVSVLDGDSNPIPGLTNSNFSVWENDIAQGPITVAPVAEDDSMSVAFVMDYSGSMSPLDLTNMEDAAATFVGNFQPGDRGAIVKFSTTVEIVQHYTADTVLLIDQIYADWPAGGHATALWTAVYSAIQETHPEQNRKAVIALTDGLSNTGSRSLQDCINISQDTSIPVFTIGLGDLVNEVDLQYLADETGGAYYYAPTSEQLAEIYAMINDVLDNQYLMLYTTSDPVEDGSVRNVYLEVEHNGFIGDDQSSYQAPGVPDLFIDITPVNPPLHIPAGGGSFMFNADLGNNQLVNAYNVDVWSQAILPDGTVYGPIFQHTFPTLPPEFSLSFTELTQDVPGYAPTGLYHFQAMIGDYPNNIVFMDEFNFTKVPFITNVTGEEVSDWGFAGWEYEISGLEANVSGVPQEFEMGAVYPNPFNSATRVQVSLPEAANLDLAVFNVMGQRVATLAEGQYNAGLHDFTLDASRLSSGLYFVRANVPGRLEQTQKVMLVR